MAVVVAAYDLAPTLGYSMACAAASAAAAAAWRRAADAVDPCLYKIIILMSAMNFFPVRPSKERVRYIVARHMNEID